jgi:hypothetical protein
VKSTPLKIISQLLSSTGSSIQKKLKRIFLWLLLIGTVVTSKHGGSLVQITIGKVNEAEGLLGTETSQGIKNSNYLPKT